MNVPDPRHAALGEMVVIVRNLEYSIVLTAECVGVNRPARPRVSISAVIKEATRQLQVGGLPPWAHDVTAADVVTWLAECQEVLDLRNEHVHWFHGTLQVTEQGPGGLIFVPPRRVRFDPKKMNPLDPETGVEVDDDAAVPALIERARKVLDDGKELRQLISPAVQDGRLGLPSQGIIHPAHRAWLAARHHDQLEEKRQRRKS